MKKFLWMLFAAAGLIAIVAGCSSMAAKAVGVASNGTVMKIETTGSTTSGTVAPNVLFGTVQNSVATAPALEKDKTTQVVVAYTEAQSSLAAAFGHTAVTRTFTYVGLPGEDAQQTKVRLDAVAKVLTSNNVSSSTSASTTSSSSTSTSASTAALTEGDSSTLGKADSSTGE